MIVVDSLLYCAMTHGLTVFDVSQPLTPETLSTLYLQEGWTTDIAASGQYVYITEWGGDTCCGPWGSIFYVIDVSNPRDPFVAGCWQTPASSYGVDILDSLAYVVYGHVQGEEGLLVLNVADPQNIALVGQLPMDVSNTVTKVQVLGDRAYIAGTFLYVVDISDVTNPSLVSQYRSSEYIPVDLEVCESDSLLYVAYLDAFWPASTSALQILSAVDPDTLMDVGLRQFRTRVLGISVEADLALVPNSTCGLQVVDVSSPDLPDSLGRYRVPGSATKVCAADTLAFLVDGGLITSEDVESPVCDPHYEVGGPFAGDLQIVSIAEPSAPSLAGFYSFPGPVTGIVVAGDMVIALNDSHVESTCPGADLAVVDISDRERPVVLSTYTTTGNAVSGAVVGDTLLYLAAGTTGLEIVNLSDPSAPVLLDTYSVPTQVVDVSVNGVHAYLAEAADGIEILDIASPGSPTQLAVIPCTFPAWSIHALGDYLYAATRPLNGGHGEILAFDVSIPAEPDLVDVYPNSIYNSVQAAGSLLVAGYLSGFRVFDISSPDTLIPRGSYTEAPARRGMSVKQNLVYVCDGWEGIEVVDITDMMSPVCVGRYNTPGFSKAIAVQERFVYVADEYALVVLEESVISYVEEPYCPVIPLSFSLRQNYPNPFNCATTIEFELHRRSHVQLEIIDLLGRTVIGLTDQSLCAGTYRVYWDGKDGHGRQVATGVYFYRLGVDGVCESKKMLYLK